MNINSVCKNELCTGCRACEQVCPVDAIKIKYNKFGFLNPSIMESCIQCGKCLEVCHIENDNKVLNIIKHCYIAYAKDKNGAKLSASGGAFFVIAKRMLEHFNCVVYGCCMDEQLNVFHTKTSDIEQLKKFQGSKYVQSDTKNTFSQVKEDLQSGKIVLYTGTPCQISGLKCFLEKDYKNLYVIDLICHGVPSIGAFKQYIAWLESDGNKIKYFRFRNRNIYDASGYLVKIKYENGKIIKLPALNDLFFRLFSTFKSLNKPCYKCEYAQPNRIGDITIGDSAAAGFLNLYRFEPKSSVFINSTKGEEIWRMISNDLVYTEIDKQIEIKRNHQLSHPGTYDLSHDDICKLMIEGKYDKLNNMYPVPQKHFIGYHDILAKVPIFIKEPLYTLLSVFRR